LEEQIEEKQSLKESILEMFFIVKVCLTSFWFWVPTLFALFSFFELYMICINPWLLLIPPSIMIIAALAWEEKRVKAQYGITEQILKSSDPLFSGPRRVATDIDVEKLVKEYEELLEKKTKQNKKAKKQ